MADLYPRKSSFTLLQIRTLLSDDPVFSKLSLAGKNAAIDMAVNKVAEYRNKLGKEDYNFDTVSMAVAPVVQITGVDDITIQLIAGVLSTLRIKPPHYTTAERDALGVTEAEIIFNTDEGRYEFYNPDLGIWEQKQSV
jgi:hypothetical protein